MRLRWVLLRSGRVLLRLSRLRLRRILLSRLRWVLLRSRRVLLRLRWVLLRLSRLRLRRVLLSRLRWVLLRLRLRRILLRLRLSRLRLRWVLLWSRRVLLRLSRLRRVLLRLSRLRLRRILLWSRRVLLSRLRRVLLGLRLRRVLLRLSRLGRVLSRLRLRWVLLGLRSRWVLLRSGWVLLRLSRLGRVLLSRHHIGVVVGRRGELSVRLTNHLGLGLVPVQVHRHAVLLGRQHHRHTLRTAHRIEYTTTGCREGTTGCREGSSGCREHISRWLRRVLDRIPLVEEEDGLIGRLDAVLDHAGVVREVLELGVVALHPVELVLVLVQAHRHVVLAVVEDHSRQVVHHIIALMLRVARQRRSVQRHHQRLSVTCLHQSHIVQRSELVLLHVVAGVDEAHGEHVREAAEHVAAAEGARAARGEEATRVVGLHGEEKEGGEVVVLWDLH